ncbi:unnamed protein product [Sphagnum jensenii]|uniref:Spindle and kinetochore-associated protein 3 n=1 Tax=Sphagnum jensenii TaxID=128206 RepID=A0ABP1AB41_9BRYO
MDAMAGRCTPPSAASLATAWSNGLLSSCVHLQSSVEKLQASVTQRCVNSIPSSNFASFLEDVNDQVSSVTADVEFLEAMTTDTLSFEELLANCTELYKQTEAGISVLETQLVQYGYIPVKAEAPRFKLEMLEEGLLHQGKVSQNLDESSPTKVTTFCPLPTEDSAATPLPLPFALSSKSNAKEDFGDLSPLSKLSLEELGISATSLSALASSDSPGDGSPLTTAPEHKPCIETQADEDKSNLSTSLTPSNPSWTQSVNEPKNLAAASSLPRLAFAEDETERLPAACVSSSPVAFQNTKEGIVESRTVSNLRLLEPVECGQFDKAPDFLISQVSLKDLNDAVTMINKIMVAKQENAELDHAILNQEDVKLLGPELKVRPILLLLVRLNKIVRDYSHGPTRYRACVQLPAQD